MALIPRLPRIRPARRRYRVAIDRTACTGRGVCAHLLAGAIERDEWGYPVVVDLRPDRREAAIAAALCPDGALYVLSDDDHHQTRRPR